MTSVIFLRLGSVSFDTTRKNANNILDEIERFFEGGSNNNDGNNAGADNDNGSAMRTVHKRIFLTHMVKNLVKWYQKLQKMMIYLHQWQVLI